MTVVCKGLSKWYGNVIGLNQLDLEMGGGVVGILGPNGAGKSTLIKLMTGLMVPSQGTVRVMGERPFANPALLARIGYCPETHGLDPRWRARDWVALQARLGGVGRARAGAAAAAALERMGLADDASRRVGGFSRGMVQRVKLAQAIVHDPPLYVLDEPMTGLDPVGRAEVIELVKSLGREGREVFVSSHILYEIEAMTNEVVILHKGRLLARGSIHEIRDLIDDHPHKVRIETPDPRGLARAIVGEESAASVEVGEGCVTVTSPQPDRFYAALPKIAVEGGFRLTHVTSPDDNLEAVFDYLVG